VLKRLRERAERESGFTMVELLVVMLILGVLAAIAIPAFLNQRGKANDASAKSEARTMQTAMETCATDHNGSYAGGATGCDIAALRQIEPTISAAVTVPAQTATTYTVQSAPAAGTSNLFRVRRLDDGTLTRTCTVGGAAQAGGCQGAANNAGATGTW